MGGSLARELASRGVLVRGCDADPATVEEARASNVLEAFLCGGEEGFRDVDLLVVAVPVDRAAASIERVLPHLDTDCVFTDVGSTKRSIVTWAEQNGIAERFVGPHPLTGGHRSGWGASHRDLYAWQRVFLCPTRQSSAAALERVRELWELVGALPEVMDADTHDRRMAWTSHLPQVAATSLALALAGSGHFRRELGPGGRDMTRLAGSSAEMWSAICLDNAEPLDAALAAFEAAIGRMRRAVAARDERALRTLFEAGRTWTQE